VTISVFDLFKIGIGPSSSHTVGPMKAAGMFVQELTDTGTAAAVAGLRVELFGSLGATGHGHGSVGAVVLGLLGHAPDQVDPAAVQGEIQAVRETGKLDLPGAGAVIFSIDDDIVLHRRRRLNFHTNGMRFHAVDGDGDTLRRRDYFSVGGGFVLGEDETGAAAVVVDPTPVPYPFRTGAQMLGHVAATGLPISAIVLANENARRPESQTREGLLRIWQVMQDCVARGCRTGGVLPGGLRVRRRAAALHRQLRSVADSTDPLRAMEWITLWALAVNEENAAGGRVVTAPTNGAAGIIPAVLHYYTRFVPGADDDGVIRFLLTAAAIGILFKEGASISGAEVGCQG
jgi:L-serine dehydratase